MLPLLQMLLKRIKVKQVISSNIYNTTSNKQGNKTLVSPDGTVNVPDFAKASKPYKGKTSYK
mgnify:CR=1 FL=1